MMNDEQRFCRLNVQSYCRNYYKKVVLKGDDNVTQLHSMFDIRSSLLCPSHQRFVDGTDAGIGQAVGVVVFAHVKGIDHYFKVHLFGVFVK